MYLCFFVLDCVLSLSVDQLGDRSFRRRAAASHRLAACGRLAVPHLQRAENHADPEIARRVAVLLGPYADEIADGKSREFLPTNWPRRPWISLYDYSISTYLSQARETVKKTGAPDWPEYREATRLWVRSALLQRRPHGEIQSELDRMATEERWWIIQHGANYNPPIQLPQHARR
jgi:hypothetical protein